MTELALLLAVAFSSQFDAADAGFGGRVGWQLTPLVGIEAEFTHYPGRFPELFPAFSGARSEGLFGATLGPRLGTVRPFARVRPGFLRVQDAPEPFACIAIFPPPLACVLPGRTLAVFDIGGGVDVSTGARTFLRLDAGDRLVKYPGPAFDNNRNVHDEDFFGHDFRVAVAGGLRF